jgi:hypothetical protein
MALEWLKQRFNEVSTGLKTEVSKIKNKSFLEVGRGWLRFGGSRRWRGPARRKAEDDGFFA